MLGGIFNSNRKKIGSRINRRPTVDEITKQGGDDNNDDIIMIMTMMIRDGIGWNQEFNNTCKCDHSKTSASPKICEQNGIQEAAINPKEYLMCMDFAAIPVAIIFL